MLETPAGQSPRFRQVEGFSALSMAGGQFQKKPKKKGTLPDALHST